MTQIAEMDRPSPKTMLPFRVVKTHQNREGGGSYYLEYEQEETIGGKLLKKPYRLPEGPLARIVLNLMEMFSELERNQDELIKQRDEANDRAQKAERLTKEREHTIRGLRGQK